MKNLHKYFNGIALLILALAIFIFGKSCNCNGGKTVVKTDTISIRRDTVITKIDTVVSHVPTPYKVTLHDTLEVEGEKQYYPIDQYPAAIQKMLTEYNATKYFKDSLQIKYGKIYVTDTLRWNRVQGRSINTALFIPEITNTVTIQTQAPRRIVGLIGAELWGNKSTPFYMEGVSAGWLSKKQKVFLLKAAIDKNGNVWYGGQYLISIRLHK